MVKQINVCLILINWSEFLIKKFNYFWEDYLAMVLEKLKYIKGVVLDVDGVLTDGAIQVNEQGHQMRTFFVKDGYAIQLAQKMGVPIWIISGGKSAGVRSRLETLGVEEVHLGISNKMELLGKLMLKYEINASELLYMGDDMPDLEVMQQVGFAACPNDAIEEIKQISHYMSPKNGGRGAVRDVLEKLLKLQGKWFVTSEIKSV